MYAIVEISGKQYKVEEGRYVDVDFLGLDQDANVTLDRVLLISDGKKFDIGQPLVEGATVQAKVLKNDKDKKIIVYKMKPKKGTRKKQGHRQQFTRLLIEKIQAKGGTAKKTAAKSTAKKDTEEKESKPKAKTSTKASKEKKAAA